MSATTITVRTAYVLPSDLEVSWAGDDWWVQPKHGADLAWEHTHKDTAEDFLSGVKAAREFISGLDARHPWNEGRILVAQTNVTSNEEGSFIATCMEPSDAAVKTLEMNF